MNGLIEQIYQAGYVSDAQGRQINLFPTSIPYTQGVMLYKLICSTGSIRTLEIGMAYGLSSLFMCQAHRDRGTGQHTAIDPWETSAWQSIGLSHIQAAGLQDILRFYELPAHIALPQLLTDGEQFDLIFIDGLHLFDHTLLEFFYADLLLTAGGHLVFDDLSLPAIRKVIAFILRNRAYERVTVCAEPALRVGKRLRRLLRYVAQSPPDLFSTVRFFTAERYCVLRKCADDSRTYEKYTSF